MISSTNVTGNTRTVRKNKSPTTQLRAIEAITQLILEYPALSAIFKSMGAEKYLLLVRPDTQRCGNGPRALLHVATRRALASVNEVKVLSMACTMEVSGVPMKEREDITAQLARYAG